MERRPPALDSGAWSGEHGGERGGGEEVAAMKVIVTPQRDETGMVVAECPSIPGGVSQGRTEEEARSLGIQAHPSRN